MKTTNPKPSLLRDQAEPEVTSQDLAKQKLNALNWNYFPEVLFQKRWRRTREETTDPGTPVKWSLNDSSSTDNSNNTCNNDDNNVTVLHGGSALGRWTCDLQVAVSISGLFHKESSLDEARIRSGHCSGLVLSVHFSAMTLTVGWQEGHPVCKKH